MTIQEAKQIGIVDYLRHLGINPARVSGKSYWYLSPLRAEKTASFKVNLSINRWYDFATGEGGDLIDLGTRIHRCNVNSFLQSLGTDRPLQGLTIIKPAADSFGDNHSIQIISVEQISSRHLLNYLHSRRIIHPIAQTFLKEVHYQLGHKKYYALGFKNDAGGFELRNQFYKGSSAPKGVTFINNDAKDLAVFEGFFNFLSYKNMYYKQDAPLSNYLILNSASFFEKNLPKMQTHQHVYLFLDNDKTGDKNTQKALNLDKTKFTDERSLYKQYNDLNEWLTKIGDPLKHHIRQKI